MSTVSIEGLDHAVVLAALYNNARPQGLGFLHYTPQDMTVEQAQNILEETQVLDYLNGRVMKVNFNDAPELRSSGYDRDNGQGSMQQVVDHIRETQQA